MSPPKVIKEDQPFSVYAQKQRQLINQFLSSDGQGGGIRNANQDYSVSPLKMYIAPPAGQVYRLARMIVQVEDSGAFDASKYGNNIELTNGITVKKTDSEGELIDFTPAPIKTNAHWGRYTYDSLLSNFGQGQVGYFSARWSFIRTGQFLLLDGNRGDSLEVNFSDDFSDLISHSMLVQGFIENLYQNESDISIA